MTAALLDFPRRVRFWWSHRRWRARVDATRHVLAPGPRTWSALDSLGVPGFGTDLIRIDFPPDLSLTQSWSGVRPALTSFLDREQARQLEFFERCLRHAGDLQAWPRREDAARPHLPSLENDFLTPCDMATLHGVLRETRPARYVEIGSGISTRVAAAARAAGGFPMEIVSIDPQPRVDVATLCDRVLRRRLEESVDEALAAATLGCVLFFDGSHRCFPGSDVTVFFLALLPRLPAGVRVHVHDIYLPDDYPAALRNRYWSEQYLLAAWLLGGGRGVRPLLPCARLTQVAEGRKILARHLAPADRPGDTAPASSSFWFDIT